MNRIFHIIRKEALLEIRDRVGFLSALLYLTAITFVVFKVFGTLSGPSKMGLYWVIFAFTCINMVSDSFSNQNQRRKLIYYQLYDPVELLMAKLLFNFTKVFLAGTVLIALVILFSGEVLMNSSLFMQCLFLSSMGLTIILCLVSSLSAYSENQNSLVAILSLPLLIPVLMLSMRVSLISERILLDSSVSDYLIMIGGIDLLLLGLSLLFIPYVWKS